MSMRTTFRTLSLLLPIVALAACAKQQGAPSAPPAVAPVAPQTTDVGDAGKPQLSDATESPLSGDLAAANEYAYRTGLLGDIYFDFDQATLRADARERLAKNAEFLKQHPEFVVVVEGHCDERGTNDYNLALGERRARAAIDYAVSLGVDGSRLRSVSYGEERPVCTEGIEACWQRNRRAHFLLGDRVGGR